MEGDQSSQSNFQRTEFTTSPVKETQAKAVREYEETINQLRKENSDLKKRLYLCEEKCDDIQIKANQESKELQEKIVALNKKIKHRDEAIKSCARKYHEETDYIPKNIRPIIKSTIQAAVDKNEKELVSSLEKLKRSLSEIMGVLIPSNLQSTYVRDSPAQDAGVNSVVQSGEYSLIEGDLRHSEMISNESISLSQKTLQCESGWLSCSDLSNTALKTENDSLRHKIESLGTALSDVKAREELFNERLEENCLKIRTLEEALEKKQNLDLASDPDDKDDFMTAEDLELIRIAADNKRNTGCSSSGHHDCVRDADTLGKWLPPDEDSSSGRESNDVHQDPVSLIKSILKENPDHCLPIEFLCAEITKQAGVSWNKKFKRTYGMLRKFVQKHSEVFRFDTVSSVVFLLDDDVHSNSC